MEIAVAVLCQLNEAKPCQSLQSSLGISIFFMALRRIKIPAHFKPVPAPGFRTLSLRARCAALEKG
ncbi:hypothetical protein [Flavobacterium sp.]|uniref:hypothetical protein n=1 Tax=Flavobacterium sp. TaxID=239 RepID=UPI0012139211|nr:hypothetical protein [Flavobacterium sp.]RZJ70930.1 MAG: hypothetical protein EOO49_12395 [Flavobacterium sp.]